MTTHREMSVASVPVVEGTLLGKAQERGGVGFMTRKKE